MTPSRASRIRDQKIAGQLPLNRDQKKSSDQNDLAEKSVQKQIILEEFLEEFQMACQSERRAGDG